VASTPRAPAASTTNANFQEVISKGITNKKLGGKESESCGPAKGASTNARPTPGTESEEICTKLEESTTRRAINISCTRGGEEVSTKVGRVYGKEPGYHLE
jgi:hypothetical protein